MEPIKKITVCFVILILSLRSYSQQIQFERIDTDDGLSQNSVISIAQDSSGFLWFATQDGLNKYDGSNFLQYEVFFIDETQGDNNKLGKVTVDRLGRVWMTTLDGGVQFCDPITEKFTYIDGVKDASFILPVDNTNYWISSFTHGLYHVIELEDEFLVKQVISDLSISKIVKHDGKLILASDEGVISYDTQSNETKSLFGTIDKVSDIEIYKSSQLIVSTLGNGLFISEDLENLKPFLQLSEDLLIQDVFIDNDGRIWLATYGEGIYNIDGDNAGQFKLKPLDETSISYDDVLSIFQDRDNNMWFGTDGGGASYIISDRKPIYSLTNNKTPNNIPVDVPRAISKDMDGNLWIGTSGKGLTVISEDLSTVDHFDTEGTSGFNLSSNRIMSLFHDSVGDLWVGTQEEGLMLKKKGASKFQQVDINLDDITVWDILELDEEHLWLCTRKEGLIVFNKKDVSWRKLNKSPGYEVLIGGNIRTIINGDKGEYFIGTEDGQVLKVNQEKGLSKIDLRGKMTGAIKSLYYDNSHLWIGTLQAGILIHDLKTGKEIQVDKSSGLPNNVVYSILPQNDRYLWISTNKGICQINKDKALQGESEIVNQHLTVESGLVSNEFNTGAYYLDDKGNMYFGGIEGVNWFDSAEILKDNNPVDIILLDLITTNRDGQDIKHINRQNSIDLNHRDKNFQIRYVAQSYAKNKTKYRYKLEGINPEWIDNESNELVSFSNIPPGDYTLLINATNNDGVWGKEPVQFGISIIPAFWQTLWFKVLSVLLSIMLLWYLYHIRVNELKRTSALKEQLTKVEAKALKLQMNPHFLFNSLNAIDNYILKNEKIKASDYLSKFSKLMRQILDYSEVSSITLTQELETLELYIKMERLRFQEKFDYELTVNPEVDTDKAKIPPLILQPFVENAIWHGLLHLEEDGKLNIEIENIKDGIKCVIEDNGIGRERAKSIKTKSAIKHKSHGIRITEERLKLNNELNKIGANIYIEDKYDDLGNPIGTKVIIHLPSK